MSYAHGSTYTPTAMFDSKKHKRTGQVRVGQLHESFCTLCLYTFKTKLRLGLISENISFKTDKDLPTFVSN